MNKILLAVDDTKGTKDAFPICSRLCSCIRPESVILAYVEKFEGLSLMDEMLGDAEMSTLKEVLEGTEYKEALDQKAKSIFEYYTNALKESGITSVKTVLKGGHPAEEILNAAREEGAEMIMIGARGHRVSHVLMGSVSREVVNQAPIPVFVAKVK